MSDLDVVTKIFILVLLLLSTAFHEMAHAFVATWLGDPTPARFGRVTLNPIPHLTPVLTAVVLPVILFMSNFGFMILATTPITPSNFRRPLRDHALVAIVGPLTNFLCAALMLAVLWIPTLAEAGTRANVALKWSIYLNCLMVIFNLIPIPPLDGSRILRLVLPFNARRYYDQLETSEFKFILVLFVGKYVLEFFDEPVRHMLQSVWPS